MKDRSAPTSCWSIILADVSVMTSPPAGKGCLCLCRGGGSKEKRSCENRRKKEWLGNESYQNTKRHFSKCPLLQDSISQHRANTH